MNINVINNFLSHRLQLSLSLSLFCLFFFCPAEKVTLFLSVANFTSPVIRPLLPVSQLSSLRLSSLIQPLSNTSHPNSPYLNLSYLALFPQHTKKFISSQCKITLLQHSHSLLILIPTLHSQISQKPSLYLLDLQKEPVSMSIHLFHSILRCLINCCKAPRLGRFLGTCPSVKQCPSYSGSWPWLPLCSIQLPKFKMTMLPLVDFSSTFLWLFLTCRIPKDQQASRR